MQTFLSLSDHPTTVWNFNMIPKLSSDFILQHLLELVLHGGGSLASVWKSASSQVEAFFSRLPRKHNICWFYFILQFVPLLFLPWSWRTLRTYETNLGQICWKSKVMFSFAGKTPGAENAGNCMCLWWKTNENLRSRNAHRWSSNTSITACQCRWVIQATSSWASRTVFPSSPVHQCSLHQFSEIHMKPN